MTKARTLADNFAADINGITAGTGITGGGTSGTVTVTNSMATEIDAKGDLVVGTGADTFARLAVASTAGYLLSVDSAEATGLKWAAPAAGGKVLQVVSSTTTTQTSIGTTSFTDTTITATITPTLNTSKILVLVNFMAGVERSARRAGGGAKLLRGATTLLDYGANNIANSDVGNGTSNNLRIAGGFHYLDNPSTTSSTTYKVQGRVEDTTSSGLIIFQDNSSPSSITLLEIGA